MVVTSEALVFLSLWRINGSILNSIPKCDANFFPYGVNLIESSI